MKILFTTSDSLLSKVIRAETGEPVSHCALQYGNWVMHCNLLGLHIELFSTFEKTSRVLYSIDLTINPNKLMATYAKFEGASYDFGALLYLGLKYLLPWLPKKNLWKSTGMFLCTEWVTELIEGYEDSEITPYQLYLVLSKRKL